MTPEQVRQLVEQEIGDRWAESNDHGVDLRTSLVTPRLIECRNTFPHAHRPDPSTLPMWVVLEEQPGSHEGYVILFDEAKRRFGLGDVSQDGRVVFLGYHGSFWETFHGM